MDREWIEKWTEFDEWIDGDNRATVVKNVSSKARLLRLESCLHCSLAVCPWQITFLGSITTS